MLMDARINADQKHTALSVVLGIAKLFQKRVYGTYNSQTGRVIIFILMLITPGKEYLYLYLLFLENIFAYK